MSITPFVRAIRADAATRTSVPPAGSNDWIDAAAWKSISMKEEGTMTPRGSLLAGVLLLIALVGGLPAVSAQAQINSPPPLLMGQPSYHLYTVPGVTSSGSTGTYFRCTNTTTVNIRVGVEVFSGGGNLINDASATSLDLYPGGSYGFGTTPAFAINMNSDLSAGPTGVGSARILATKPKGVVCTAFLGDPVNGPPEFMVHLNIIKKTTQKGD